MALLHWATPSPGRVLAAAGRVAEEFTAAVTGSPDAGYDPANAAPRGRAAAPHPLREAVLGVAAYLAWALLLTVALAAATAVLARLPGRIGAVAGHLHARFTPRAARRLAATALGVSLGAAAPSLALAAAHEPDSRGSAESGATSLDWPGLDREEPPQASVPGRGNAPVRSTYSVQAGDCLWFIAQRELGDGAGAAAVDRRWRAWYRENAQVIGEDPDLIHPGQLLRAPERRGPR